VLLGDKQEAHKYKQYNAGHVADIIHEGASPWGTHWIGESKVVSPFTATHHAGRGTREGGGTASDVGHLYAFGNTEEGLHRTILGCAARGTPADGPFDHATGRGHVAFHRGDYWTYKVNTLGTSNEYAYIR